MVITHTNRTQTYAHPVTGRPYRVVAENTERGLHVVIAADTDGTLRWFVVETGEQLYDDEAGAPL